LLCKELPNGLRYWALGRAWILFGSRKNSKPEKYLKTAQNPQRPVHALLGAVELKVCCLRMHDEKLDVSFTAFLT
jgi:hypothetical protein